MGNTVALEESAEEYLERSSFPFVWELLADLYPRWEVTRLQGKRRGGKRQGKGPDVRRTSWFRDEHHAGSKGPPIATSQSEDGR